MAAQSEPCPRGASRQAWITCVGSFESRRRATVAETLRSRFAPGMGLQKVDERLERRPRLPPAGIVKEEPERTQRPILQQIDEALSRDERVDRTDRLARATDAVDGGPQLQFAIDDDE